MKQLSARPENAGQARGTVLEAERGQHPGQHPGAAPARGVAAGAA
ncbi:hypothetical protein [Kitasatospora aureofaciens]|nr:hypothetical protein [Kitasatospora aureofaciens]